MVSVTTAATKTVLGQRGNNKAKVTCKRCGYVATKYRKMKLQQVGTAVSFWCPGCTSNRGVCLDCNYQMVLRGPLSHPPQAMKCHFGSRAHQRQVHRNCCPPTSINKKVPICTPSPALDTTATTSKDDPDLKTEKKASNESHQDDEDSDDEEDVMLLSLKKPSANRRKRKVQQDVTSESDSDDEEDVMLISLKKKTSKPKKNKRRRKKKAKQSKSSSFSDEEMEDNHQQPAWEEKDPLDMGEESDTEVIDNSFRLRCKICRDCAMVTEKYESVRMWGTALAGEVVRFKCCDGDCPHQWAVCRTCDDFKIERGNFMAIRKHFKSHRHQKRCRERFPVSGDESLGSEESQASQESDSENLFGGQLKVQKRKLDFEEDTGSSEEEEDEDESSDHSGPGSEGSKSSKSDDSEESNTSGEWDDKSSVALSELSGDDEQGRQSETDDSDSD